MRKIILILTISLLLSLTIKWDCIQGKSITVNDEIISIFKNTKTDIILSSINASGTYKKNPDINQMENMVRDIANYFDIDSTSIYVRKDCSDSQRQVLIKGINNMNSTINVEVQSILGNNGKFESIILVDIYHNGEFNSDIISSKIKTLYAGYESIPDLNICVVGTMEGKLNNAQTNKLKKVALKQFKIYMVDSIEDSGAITVMGYSIPNNKVKGGGGNTNINLSTKYNLEENKTYMWISTPKTLKEYK